MLGPLGLPNNLAGGFVAFVLGRHIMGYTVDSLILKDLSDMPPCRIEDTEIEVRCIAAVCKSDEPHSLPRSLFCPRTDEKVQFGQSGQSCVCAL